MRILQTFGKHGSFPGLFRLPGGDYEENMPLIPAQASSEHATEISSTTGAQARILGHGRNSGFPGAVPANKPLSYELKKSDKPAPNQHRRRHFRLAR